MMMRAAFVGNINFQACLFIKNRSTLTQPERPALFQPLYNAFKISLIHYLCCKILPFYISLEALQTQCGGNCVKTAGLFFLNLRKLPITIK